MLPPYLEKVECSYLMLFCILNWPAVLIKIKRLKFKRMQSRLIRLIGVVLLNSAMLSSIR